MAASPARKHDPASQLPIIDIGALRQQDPTGSRRVAQALREACVTTGFFYVTNHGVADADVAQIFAEAKRFFDEPLVAKESVGLKTNSIFRGYDGIRGQALDAATGGDVKESIYMGIDLPLDDPLVVAGTPNHGPNPWPEWLPGWRQSVLDYFATMEHLARILLHGLALSLDLAPEHFDYCLEGHMSAVRLLHYPPHPEADPDREVGCGVHTDWGVLTILAQDATGGLEVQLPWGEWIAAQPVPGAFVINIGDMMARWTNDLYASTPHRVLNRSPRDRYSAAFFFDPGFHTTVECLPTCTSDARPMRYPPTTSGEHLLAMKLRSYANL
ncbi:MAG: isopenicillin synthase family oxygenase [Rhodospirillales bacterium]|nr:isopenicillin synthase family oxygenase [Rhodospirillales bacterium]